MGNTKHPSSSLDNHSKSDVTKTIRILLSIFEPDTRRPFDFHSEPATKRHSFDTHACIDFFFRFSAASFFDSQQNNSIVFKRIRYDILISNSFPLTPLYINSIGGVIKLRRGPGRAVSGGAVLNESHHIQVADSPILLRVRPSLLIRSSTTSSAI